MRKNKIQTFIKIGFGIGAIIITITLGARYYTFDQFYSFQTTTNPFFIPPVEEFSDEEAYTDEEFSEYMKHVNTKYEAEKDKGIYWSITLFVVMVIGILFNQFFEILQKKKTAGEETINVKELFQKGFNGINFWMAIFVSPLIFFVTLDLTNSIVDYKITLLFAFQSGFFWYTIFNKIDIKFKS